MPRTSNPISEHATSMSYGEIAISDLNVATRQYVAATNTGRVGNTPPNAGFNWNSDNGLKTLHEWVGGMYFSADPSGTADGSLSTGPHAYTMYPSFKGKYCSQNKLRPIPGEGVSMGDMRQHTPITILARTKCRTHDENDYYDGVDGSIALRPYGVDGLNTTFTVTIAGDTHVFASANSGGKHQWTGLGSEGSDFNGYRAHVQWSYPHGFPPALALQSIDNMAFFIGTSKQGSTFHGIYGWAPALKSYETGVNYVAKYFGNWTSRDNLPEPQTAESKATTGGSQVPNATSAGQEEFFYDWFYADTTTIKLEASGDDSIQIEVRDPKENILYDSGLTGGGWNGEDPPISQTITLPEPGWYQVMCKAKESPGATPAFVGCVIWDKAVYGEGGPPVISTLKSGDWPSDDNYSVKISDGFLWTSRLASGMIRPSEPDLAYGAARWFTDNGSMTRVAGKWSDRFFWRPQQHSIYREKVT